MYVNILKKDLKRKKSMNIILFLFIVLCTTFMAGSVNNLLTTMNALDYFQMKSNTSDYLMIAKENEAINHWIQTSQHIISSEKDNGIIVNEDDLLIQNGTYKASGTTALVKIPETYNLILDALNQPITAMKSGEIAISYTEAQNNNLGIGDTITISLGDKEKILTVTQIIKDMAFGSAYMGFTRLLISAEDFTFFEESEEVMICQLYSIMSEDTTALEKDLNRQSFSVISNFDRNMLRNVYLMEMMIAAILIIVSICLIIIAIVMLHFTIAFTLQEDYKEIGIMKAIGLKNAGIKGLYIIKYFFLAVIGAVVGIFLSIPLGNMMTESISNSMAMESAAGNLYINVVCGALVVLLVITFCYISAGKLGKFTAMQAIRSGSGGERYQSKGIYQLRKHRKVPVVLQMAINDILSHFRSYIVMVIIFVLGTLLIILPLNAANTLRSEDAVEYFGIARSDVYISNFKENDYMEKASLNYVLEDIEALENLYREGGVDITLYVEYGFMAKVYVEDPNSSSTFLGLQAQNFDASNYNMYIDGAAPMLANEIAMTELSMEKLGVSIGDSVSIMIGDTTLSYIVTGSYQSMNMMGEGLRFSSVAETNFQYTSGIYSLQGNFADRTDIDGQIRKLKELTPDYTIKTPFEYISTNMGATMDTLDSLISMIIVVVLFINCLITVLMTRTFIIRDIGEIALLKSIGFTDRAAKIWQTLRVIIVLVISITLGILLSNLLNPIVFKYTFGIMGADKVQPHIIAMEVYLFYPLLLLAGTGIAAVLSTGMIGKIKLTQIRNIE